MSCKNRVNITTVTMFASICPPHTFRCFPANKRMSTNIYASCYPSTTYPLVLSEGSGGAEPLLLRAGWLIGWRLINDEQSDAIPPLICVTQVRLQVYQTQLCHQLYMFAALYNAYRTSVFAKNQNYDSCKLLAWKNCLKSSILVSWHLFMSIQIKDKYNVSEQLFFSTINPMFNLLGRLPHPPRKGGSD